MTTVVHDLEQTDGNISLRITLLREDLVENAEAVLTAERDIILEVKWLLNAENYLDSSVEALSPVESKIKQQHPVADKLFHKSNQLII
jgi:hypothetical protein